MNPTAFLPSAPGQALRTSRGYWAFLPAPLPPNLQWTPALINLLAEAERELARLGEVGKAFPNPHPMVQSFVRREAVRSSRIEGTRTTLEELYAYEANPLPEADRQEVYNYVRALDYGLQRLETLPISLRYIRELHAILMEGVRGDVWTPGEFRRSQNWIGPAGSTLDTAPYVPPPVEEMHLALAALENFIHAPPDLPVLIRLGMIHYQFEAIHPFLDGNGRVGRLLIPLLICAWDLLPQPYLYVSVFFETHRLEYYARLLGVSQRGEWEAWLTFFLTGVRDQAREAALRLGQLRALRVKYGEWVQPARARERLNQVLDFLLGHPLVSIRQVQEGLGLGDFKTAQRYLRQLEILGILREVSGRARNRLYRANEILNAIEGAL